MIYSKFSKEIKLAKEDNDKLESDLAIVKSRLKSEEEKTIKQNRESSLANLKVESAIHNIKNRRASRIATEPLEMNG